MATVAVATNVRTELPDPVTAAEAPCELYTPSVFWNDTPLSASEFVMPVTFAFCSRNPIVPTASTATATHKTGRHRRDGGWPSGNSRTTRSRDATARIGVAFPTEATVWKPGSEPGAVTNPRRAYCSARTVYAKRTPITDSRQPMGFRDTRLPIRPPTLA